MQSHSFSQLGLDPGLVDAVHALGYEDPTEIQAAAIPLLLEGKNLLGTAQTGTGKTAAFTLPLLHRMHLGGRPKAGGGRASRPQALFLAPTRELAIQIDESVGSYGARLKMSHTAVFGGAPKSRQLRELGKNPRVLSATPGRLLDFVSEGAIDLSGVEIFVIDEADRMLDMGFIPDVRRIAKLLTSREQTALFSATMPSEIEKLAHELLGRSERVGVAPTGVTADGIKQSVLHLARENKTTVLPDLIKDRGMYRVLVFTRTKHRASKVSRILNKTGIPSDEIHGNRSQNQRQRALASFRSGKVQALVATDVAARGIDVDEISHVINFEIPNEAETYVHRIGRTARAGNLGEAISLCDAEERADFARIERFIKHEVDVDRNHEWHEEPPRRTPQPGPKGNARQGGSARAGGRKSDGRQGAGRQGGARSRGRSRSRGRR
jgi:ATP-dependent RNA helicase RhlE